MSRFEIKNEFYLDGAPFKIISGAIHYFRVVPEYWQDRLLKLKAMGCNTVETYIPWNMHEPKQGEYNFSGRLDVAKFLKTAGALGLYAIVRPSPFICAEWEFGGQPAWLLKEDNIPVRTSEGPFLSYMESYYKALFSQLAPLQIDNGGPIILMQVENEYGAFGDDPHYLESMAQIMRKSGATVPFITSNNFENDVSRGTFSGALVTANFGSGAKEKFEELKKHTNGGPLMCAEFWDGWFDAWGDEKHHTTSAKDCAHELDEVLKRGSVNIYMFHGGTNFGFMNGSNDYGRITPDVTSYDYDAPLSEDGRITEKYNAFQRVISKYACIPDIEIPQSKTFAYGRIEKNGQADLFESLDKLSIPQKLSQPKSMERLGQSYGYILYSHILKYNISTLTLDDVHDRVHIFIDGKLVKTLFDREIKGTHQINAEKGSAILLLVENLGRVNYGPALNHQRKGIDNAVLGDDTELIDWEVRSLPLTDLSRICYINPKDTTTPAFYRFTFNVNMRTDSFIDLDGFGKGCVFMNGFALGRYWNIGPQKRLYLPAPLLIKGVNEIIVFETEGKSANYITLTDEPALG